MKKFQALGIKAQLQLKGTLMITQFAYRYSDSILKANDDIEIFGDVYNGVFGPGGVEEWPVNIQPYQ